MNFSAIRSENPDYVRLTVSGKLSAEIPLSIEVIRGLDSEAYDAIADALEEQAAQYRRRAERWRNLESPSRTAELDAELEGNDRLLHGDKRHDRD